MTATDLVSRTFGLIILFPTNVLDRYGSRGDGGGRRYDDYGRGGSSRPVEGAAAGGYGGEPVGAPGAGSARGYEDDRYSRR